ncbi:MAG: glycerol-3-phosphate 1-O-acyltransferase PlsY [bacterium]
MNLIKILVSLILGFICGIIPFAYLIGRLKGVDLKKTGSGNIGSTNLGRSLGITFFIIGFLLDGAKGLLPVLIAKSGNIIPIFAGAGAIIGHIFNPFFKFKGGKGVATTIGVLLGIVPLQFLVSIAVWLIVYLSTFIVSVASISMAIALPITTFAFTNIPLSEKFFIMVVSILIIFAHRSNIKRLFNKTEPKTIFWKKK